MYNDLTAFLYAKPSLAEGVARAIDFGATLEEYNSSPDGAAADRFALFADWMMTYGDMAESFRQVIPAPENRATMLTE